MDRFVRRLQNRRHNFELVSMLKIVEFPIEQVIRSD